MTNSKLFRANLLEFNQKLCQNCSEFHYVLSVELGGETCFQASNYPRKEFIESLLSALRERMNALEKGTKPFRLQLVGVASAEDKPYQSGTYFPIRHGQRNYGFLLALGEWPQQQICLVNGLLEGLGALVARLQQEMNMSEVLLEVVTSAVTALEAKDPYTRGHSDRVARYSYLVGQRLGLLPEQLEMLSIAAKLHDIGKIGVREAILTKKEALSFEEWQEIRQHPILGEKILRPITLLSPALAVVLHHHERYDGSGYPYGLHGENIPLGARIVSVADAFDAMISNRPYRQSFTVAQALEEIQANAGRQFDPHVVNAFLGLEDEELTPPSKDEAGRL